MNAPQPHPDEPSATPPATHDPDDVGAGMLVLGGLVPEADVSTGAGGAGGAACAECAEGRYDADGYCGTCGAKAADPRDHEELAPASWAAGVCDRGIRHRSNEDALALGVAGVAGDDRGDRGDRNDRGDQVAALVVCDGVSTAARSAEASRAAADAALEVLLANERGAAADDAAAHGGALLDAAADAAAHAVAGLTAGRGGSAEDVGLDVFATNPSCTFVAAVLTGDVAVVGCVGDSRAYWFPDAGAAARLTSDDSWAEEQIRLGADRATAEAGPQSHTITRWIGVDAPDHTPSKAVLHLDGPGWFMLCSDGLWNYASEAAHLAVVVRAALRTLDDVADPQDDPTPRPLRLARALVDWANAQGGRDNITVALARIDQKDSRDA